MTIDFVLFNRNQTGGHSYRVLGSFNFFSGNEETTKKVFDRMKDDHPSYTPAGKEGLISLVDENHHVLDSIDVDLSEMRAITTDLGVDLHEKELYIK